MLTTLMWCLKEAYVKATGKGLVIHPQRVEVCLESDVVTYRVDVKSVPARVLWTCTSKRCILVHVKTGDNQ